MAAAVGLVLVVQRETGLQRNLVVAHLALLDMAARLDDLEPSQMLYRLRGPCDGALNRILDAGLGGADEFDDLVDMVLHGDALLSAKGRIVEIRRRGCAARFTPATAR